MKNLLELTFTVTLLVVFLALMATRRHTHPWPVHEPETVLRARVYCTGGTQLYTEGSSAWCQR